MKLREGYVLRTVAGQHLVLPVGETARQLNGSIMLNESGAFLWRLLSASKSRDELVSALLEEYDTDSQTAEKAVDMFISQLSAVPGVLDSEEK